MLTSKLKIYSNYNETYYSAHITIIGRMNSALSRGANGRFVRARVAAPAQQQQRNRVRVPLAEVTNTPNTRTTNQRDDIKQLKAENAELRQRLQAEEERQRLAKEAARKAEWRKKKAAAKEIAAGGLLGVNNKSHEIRKRIRTVQLKPDAEHQQRRNFTHKHANQLEAYLRKFKDEGPEGYSAATVVAGLLRRHPRLKDGVLDQLKVGQAIQQETLDAIHKHRSCDWMDGFSSATGLKARGLRYGKKMLLHRWCRTTMDWVPIDLPYDLGPHQKVPEPPGEDAMRGYRQRTAEEYGLVESSAGDEVHINLKKPLQTRLSLMPRSILIPQLKQGRGIRVSKISSAISKS